MKIKCEYCNSYINDYDEKCPNCGATNKHLKRVAIEEPKTIEELKQWYKDRNLPPEKVTRFFIGSDYKFPKAFGIYKDENTGNFVVYKNKADGKRAIRYEGKDESYAVNELYQRLKTEIANQKNLNAERQQSKRKMSLSTKFMIWAFCILLGLATIGQIYTNRYTRGYYNYNGTYYYQQGGDWYVYRHAWLHESDVPEELTSNYNDYYESSDYSLDYGTSDFKDTSFYKEYEAHWDSGSDWDSGSSWDSGGTDWTSDW